MGLFRSQGKGLRGDDRVTDCLGSVLGGWLRPLSLIGEIKAHHARQNPIQGSAGRLLFGAHNCVSAGQSAGSYRSHFSRSHFQEISISSLFRVHRPRGLRVDAVRLSRFSVQALPQLFLSLLENDSLENDKGKVRAAVVC